jgi:hypothetical protein
VIAAKLHAVVVRGMVNRRLKDDPDLVVMVERETLDAATLARGAIAAMFQRRGTGLPAALPVGLSKEFAGDATRRALWHALLNKHAIAYRPLVDVVAVIQAVVWRRFNARRPERLARRWRSDGKTLLGGLAGRAVWRLSL